MSKQARDWRGLTLDHLGIVLQNIDVRKASKHVESRFMMKSATGLLEELYPPKTPLKTIAFTVIAQKDGHRLIIYRTLEDSNVYYGVLKGDSSICYTVSAIEIISWLMPTNMMTEPELHKMHSLLVDKTEALVYPLEP